MLTQTKSALSSSALLNDAHALVIDLSANGFRAASVEVGSRSVKLRKTYTAPPTDDLVKFIRDAEKGLTLQLYLLHFVVICSPGVLDGTQLSHPGIPIFEMEQLQRELGVRFLVYVRDFDAQIRALETPAAEERIQVVDGFFSTSAYALIGAGNRLRVGALELPRGSGKERLLRHSYAERMPIPFISKEYAGFLEALRLKLQEISPKHREGPPPRWNDLLTEDGLLLAKTVTGDSAMAESYFSRFLGYFAQSVALECAAEHIYLSGPLLRTNAHLLVDNAEFCGGFRSSASLRHLYATSVNFLIGEKNVFYGGALQGYIQLTNAE